MSAAIMAVVGLAAIAVLGFFCFRAYRSWSAEEVAEKRLSARLEAARR